MTKLLGIDVSEHNGAVNWEKIKASGVKFAMLRASWGHFAEDKQLRRNVAECKRVGMPFGLYHYSYADNEANARMEATRFLALAKELGGYSYPLNLDMEDADGWKANNGVGDDMNLKTIRIFKEVIEGAGEYLTLYMSKSWFDRLRAKDGALIDSLDAWLAHWGIAEPSMPCGMWQYTSDGKVNGSSARTDMNYAYKDYPSILGKKPSKPSKPTNPTPSTPTGTTLDLAYRVMKNEFGAGNARKQALGSRYNEVQAFIDHIATASDQTLANEVKAGKYGNGAIRKTVLGNRYDKVQAIINGQPAAPKMTARQFALEVWNEGKHGTGQTRVNECKKYGVDYNEVQRLLGILQSGGKI